MYTLASIGIVFDSGEIIDWLDLKKKIADEILEMIICYEKKTKKTNKENDD